MKLKEVISETEAEQLLKVYGFHEDAVYMYSCLDFLDSIYTRHDIDDSDIMRIIGDIFCYSGFFHRLVLPVTESDALEIFLKLFSLRLSLKMFPVFRWENTYYKPVVSKWWSGTSHLSSVSFIEADAESNAVQINVNITEFTENRKFTGRLLRYLLDSYCEHHKIGMEGLERVLVMGDL